MVPFSHKLYITLDLFTAELFELELSWDWFNDIPYMGHKVYEKSGSLFKKMTIRINKAKIKQNSNNGYGYRHFISCDEIPECKTYGSTVYDALEKFQKLAELWINLSP